ncbi:hypothetical protein [Shewanella mangrovisoli]|uniref:hypothetical protein n=1 Tax=Shewanella mangrovisoli TaxID=2864211 RepID=UPI001C65E2AB|nr:hypothetical protein [Shewanella mangrovisoli]QYK08493.1 hypothetical protein K0H60_17020 [Shewanella mangrovisoli]
MQDGVADILKGINRSSIDVELTATTKSFGGVADIFKGVNRSSIEVELTSNTCFEGLLAHPRESTDQDGGINSQEYANYRSFA